nr:TPA: membrane protein, putative [Neospora caninum Liverpool]
MPSPALGEEHPEPSTASVPHHERVKEEHDNSPLPTGERLCASQLYSIHGPCVRHGEGETSDGEKGFSRSGVAPSALAPYNSLVDEILCRDVASSPGEDDTDSVYSYYSAPDASSCWRRLSVEDLVSDSEELPFLLSRDSRHWHATARGLQSSDCVASPQCLSSGPSPSTGNAGLPLPPERPRGSPSSRRIRHAASGHAFPQSAAGWSFDRSPPTRVLPQDAAPVHSLGDSPDRKPLRSPVEAWNCLGAKATCEAQERAGAAGDLGAPDPTGGETARFCADLPARQQTRTLDPQGASFFHVSEEVDGLRGDEGRDNGIPQGPGLTGHGPCDGYFPERDSPARLFSLGRPALASFSSRHWNRGDKAPRYFRKQTFTGRRVRRPHSFSPSLRRGCSVSLSPSPPAARPGASPTSCRLAPVPESDTQPFPESPPGEVFRFGPPESLRWRAAHAASPSPGGAPPPYPEDANSSLGLRCRHGRPGSFAVHPSLGSLASASTHSLFPLLSSAPSAAPFRRIGGPHAPPVSPAPSKNAGLANVSENATPEPPEAVEAAEAPEFLPASGVSPSSAAVFRGPPPPPVSPPQASRAGNSPRPCDAAFCPFRSASAVYAHYTGRRSRRPFPSRMVSLDAPSGLPAPSPENAFGLRRERNEEPAEAVHDRERGNWLSDGDVRDVPNGAARDQTVPDPRREGALETDRGDASRVTPAEPATLASLQSGEQASAARPRLDLPTPPKGCAGPRGPSGAGGVCPAPRVHALNQVDAETDRHLVGRLSHIHAGCLQVQRECARPSERDRLSLAGSPVREPPEGDSAEGGSFSASRWRVAEGHAQPRPGAPECRSQGEGEAGTPEGCAAFSGASSSAQNTRRQDERGSRFVSPLSPSALEGPSRPVPGKRDFMDLLSSLSSVGTDAFLSPERLRTPAGAVSASVLGTWPSPNSAKGSRTPPEPTEGVPRVAARNRSSPSEAKRAFPARSRGASTQVYRHSEDADGANRPTHARVSEVDQRRTRAGRGGVATPTSDAFEPDSSPFFASARASPRSFAPLAARCGDSRSVLSGSSRDRLPELDMPKVSDPAGDGDASDSSVSSRDMGSRPPSFPSRRGDATSVPSHAPSSLASSVVLRTERSRSFPFSASDASLPSPRLSDAQGLEHSRLVHVRPRNAQRLSPRRRGARIRSLSAAERGSNKTEARPASPPEGGPGGPAVHARRAGASRGQGSEGKRLSIEGQRRSRGIDDGDIAADFVSAPSSSLPFVPLCELEPQAGLLSPSAVSLCSAFSETGDGFSGLPGSTSSSGGALVAPCAAPGVDVYGSRVSRRDSGVLSLLADFVGRPGGRGSGSEEKYGAPHRPRRCAASPSVTRPVPLACAVCSSLVPSQETAAGRGEEGGREFRNTRQSGAQWIASVSRSVPAAGHLTGNAEHRLGAVNAAASSVSDCEHGDSSLAVRAAVEDEREEDLTYVHAGHAHFPRRLHQRACVTPLREELAVLRRNGKAVLCDSFETVVPLEASQTRAFVQLFLEQRHQLDELRSELARLRQEKEFARSEAPSALSLPWPRERRRREFLAAHAGSGAARPPPAAASTGGDASVATNPETRSEKTGRGAGSAHVKKPRDSRNPSTDLREEEREDRAEDVTLQTPLSSGFATPLLSLLPGAPASFSPAAGNLPGAVSSGRIQGRGAAETGRALGGAGGPAQETATQGETESERLREAARQREVTRLGLSTAEHSVAGATGACRAPPLERDATFLSPDPDSCVALARRHTLSFASETRSRWNLQAGEAREDGEDGPDDFRGLQAPAESLQGPGVSDAFGARKARSPGLGYGFASLPALRDVTRGSCRRGSASREPAAEPKTEASLHRSVTLPVKTDRWFAAPGAVASTAPRSGSLFSGLEAKPVERSSAPCKRDRDEDDEDDFWPEGCTIRTRLRLLCAFVVDEVFSFRRLSPSETPASQGAGAPKAGSAPPSGPSLGGSLRCGISPGDEQKQQGGILQAVSELRAPLSDAVPGSLAACTPSRQAWERSAGASPLRRVRSATEASLQGDAGLRWKRTEAGTERRHSARFEASPNLGAEGFRERRGRRQHLVAPYPEAARAGRRMHRRDSEVGEPFPPREGLERPRSTLARRLTIGETAASRSGGFSVASKGDAFPCRPQSRSSSVRAEPGPRRVREPPVKDARKEVKREDRGAHGAKSRSPPSTKAGESDDGGYCTIPETPLRNLCRVPYRLERVVYLGTALCLDAVLYEVTFMPIQALVLVARLVLGALGRHCRRPPSEERSCAEATPPGGSFAHEDFREHARFTHTARARECGGRRARNGEKEERSGGGDGDGDGDGGGNGEKPEPSGQSVAAARRTVGDGAQAETAGMPGGVSRTRGGDRAFDFWRWVARRAEIWDMLRRLFVPLLLAVQVLFESLRAFTLSVSRQLVWGGRRLLLLLESRRGPCLPREAGTGKEAGAGDSEALKTDPGTAQLRRRVDKKSGKKCLRKRGSRSAAEAQQRAAPPRHGSGFFEAAGISASREFFLRVSRLLPWRPRASPARSVCAEEMETLAKPRAELARGRDDLPGPKETVEAFGRRRGSGDPASRGVFPPTLESAKGASSGFEFHDAPYVHVEEPRGARHFGGDAKEEETGKGRREGGEAARVSVEHRERRAAAGIPGEEELKGNGPKEREREDGWGCAVSQRLRDWASLFALGTRTSPAAQNLSRASPAWRVASPTARGAGDSTDHFRRGGGVQLDRDSAAGTEGPHREATRGLEPEAEGGETPENSFLTPLLKVSRTDPQHLSPTAKRRAVAVASHSSSGTEAPAFPFGAVELPPPLSPADVCALVRFSLLVASVSLFLLVDTSWVYHYIRAQPFMKLYVVFNMLELFETMWRSLGRDIFDALMRTTVQLLSPQPQASRLSCRSGERKGYTAPAVSEVAPGRWKGSGSSREVAAEAGNLREVAGSGEDRSEQDRRGEPERGDERGEETEAAGYRLGERREATDHSSRAASGAPKSGFDSQRCQTESPVDVKLSLCEEEEPGHESRFFSLSCERTAPFASEDFPRVAALLKCHTWGGGELGEQCLALLENREPTGCSGLASVWTDSGATSEPGERMATPLLHASKESVPSKGAAGAQEGHGVSLSHASLSGFSALLAGEGRPGGKFCRSVAAPVDAVGFLSPRSPAALDTSRPSSVAQSVQESADASAATRAPKPAVVASDSPYIRRSRQTASGSAPASAAAPSPAPSTRPCRAKGGCEGLQKWALWVCQYLLVLAYVLVHTCMHLIRVLSLNIAINSSESTMFLIVVTNNFGEIKSTVFKKHAPTTLYSIVAADVVERFQLCCDAFIVSLKLATASSPRATSLATVCSWLCGVFLLEIAVDWVKFLYLVKFNNIRAAAFDQYQHVLLADVLLSRVPQAQAELLPDGGFRVPCRGMYAFSHIPTRRIGFMELPIVTLIIACLPMVSWTSTSTLVYAVLGWICLFVSKVFLSLMIVAFATKRRKNLRFMEQSFGAVNAL